MPCRHTHCGFIPAELPENSVGPIQLEKEGERLPSKSPSRTLLFLGYWNVILHSFLHKLGVHIPCRAAFSPVLQAACNQQSLFKDRQSPPFARKSFLSACILPFSPLPLSSEK